MKICQPRPHGGLFHMQIITAKICQFNPLSGIMVHNPSGDICIHNLRPNQERLRTLGPLPGIYGSSSKNSKWKRLRCFAFLWKCKRNNERDNLKTRNNYSLRMQEIVLCKKIDQRWLSINLLYKTFFKLSHTKIFFVGSYDPHFCQ
jgi:hypothetical protein